MLWADEVDPLDEPRPAGSASSRMETLSREECLALLATQEVGRLGISSAAGPVVVPVNFVLDGDSIIFRSAPGPKLRTLAARPVSFQVDGIDLANRTGWSVLARGHAREISRKSVAHLDLVPFVEDGKDHWVRLRIAAISGRRIC